MSDRFRDALTGAWQRIEERQWLYGHLGKMNTDESYTLAVPGRKNFVYVTIRNSAGAQSAVPARNDAAVALEARIPVKMRLEKGVYVIVSRSGRTDLGSPLIPPVNPHAHALNDLSDVTLTTPADGDIVHYSTGVWVNTPFAHNHNSIYFTEAEFINVSAGAGDAGKPIVLDAGGQIDATMINDADINHGSIGGLGNNDHPQYSLTSHSHALDGLSDVDLTGLTDGQGITYDLATTTWKPASIAAGDFVDRDGSRPLTGDWNIGNGRKIILERIDAVDADGISFYDDGGVLAFKIADTGWAKFPEWLYIDRTGGDVTHYMWHRARGAAEAGAFGNAAGNGQGEIGAVGLSGLVIGTYDATPLIFGMNNAEAARIDTSGNFVNLGAIFSNKASSAGFMRVGSSSDDKSVQMGFSGTSFGYIQAANWAQSGGATLFALNPSGGNVGIGTSTIPQTLTLNSASFPGIQISVSDVAKAYWGVSTGVDQWVTGSVSGDVAIRTQGGKLFFSADSGTTAHAILLSTGLLGLGVSPSYFLHGKKNQNASTAFVVQNDTDGTGAQASVATLGNNGSFSMGKYAPSTTAHKILDANVAYLYNNTSSGHIAILNDYASGDIKLAAGGHSLSDLRILSGGGVIVYGQEATDAILYIEADNGDDNADLFRLRMNQSGTLYFEYYTGAAWDAHAGFFSATDVSDFYGDVYVTGNVSALSFTDRTDFYSGNAVAEIAKIKPETGGKKLDHSTLPEFAKAKNGERNLGNMISILIVAIQQLDARLAKLEAM